LLDALKGRWNFPELKEIAIEQNEYWEPDMMLIEAKASGQPLADEMRMINLPVVTFSPGRRKGGNLDKTTRMHIVSPIFESGKVWYPNSKFADEVIEEVASFPNGDHDDYCDSMTMAIMRFRQGGFISLQGEEEPEDWFPRRSREYY
jgi:predicted phage terminase large subunit-like protein